MKTLRSVILCLIVIFSSSSFAKAAPISQDWIPTLYVREGGTSVNCTSWTDACELQTALSKNTTNLVLVAAGTYTPDKADPSNRAATFNLISGVMIYGGFPANGGTWEQRDWESNVTTLSGNIGDVDSIADNSYHVVTTNGANWTARLDGLTISGGNANGAEPHNFGGGMYNAGGNPTLSNVIFSRNAATRGGGIYNDGSSPKLSNVTFSGNTAVNGAGMYNNNTNNSSPSLSNVRFVENPAASTGGGMYNSNSDPTLTDVIFAGNSARDGGGMYNYNSNPPLSNVTFSGNVARGHGGGMYNDHSNPILTNVTLSENSAYIYVGAPAGETGWGGGMLNYMSSPTLTNVTFFGNSAEVFGGGMYNWVFASKPIVTNTIIWGNSPALQIYNDDGTPIITYSDIQGVVVHPGIGNINTDPLLVPLANNGGFTQTHALPLGSPAIDKGDPANCPTTDQRGYPRPIDGNGDGSAICDMGAYEYESFTLTVTVMGNGSVAKNPDKAGYPFGEEVTLTATANSDWTFSGWSGDATGTANPLTMNIQGNTSITATFIKDNFKIHLPLILKN